MGIMALFDDSKKNSKSVTPVSVISEIQFHEMLVEESGDLAIEALHAETGALEEGLMVSQSEVESRQHSIDQSTSNKMPSDHDASTEILKSSTRNAAELRAKVTIEQRQCNNGEGEKVHTMAQGLVEGDELRPSFEKCTTKGVSKHLLNAADHDEALPQSGKFELEELSVTSVPLRRAQHVIKTGLTTSEAIDLLESDDETM